MDHQGYADFVKVNFLKYFYHLFPLHVEKFYWLFDRYVNPKIEELKGSIIPIRAELNIIHGIISSLSKTNICIESSQSEIQTNTQELNTSIESRDTFEQLVASIVNELKKLTDEIKQLDKVNEIKSKLAEMYKSVKSEAQRKLCEIKEKFSSHETDFKGKLCNYVRQIRENLETLAQEPHAKIGDLKKKIVALVGEKNVCGKSSGKLVDLENKIREANKKYNYYGTHSFMKKGERLDHSNFQKVLKVERKIQEFVRYAFGYLESVYETQRRLCYILDTLSENTDFGRIINEINGFTRVNIDTYEKKIKEHEAKVHLLNPLSIQIKPYENSLIETMKGRRKEKGLKDVTKAVKDLKDCVEKNKKHLDEIFVEEIASITDIQDKELDEITTDIQEIIDVVKTTQNFITNTRLFFGYLKTFQLHKSKIEKLNIEGDSISDIQKTISSIVQATSAIEGTMTPIHDEKQNLVEHYKDTWGKGETREKAMPTVIEWHFPGELNLLSLLVPLMGFLVKLAYIQYFNNAIEGADLKSHLGFLVVSMNGTRSIGDLLAGLISMDSCLSFIKEKIGKLVGMIESSHEITKSRLSGSPNGNGITSNVNKISEIPEKLSDLHKSVRIYIQLTQTVSNVIGTLYNMIPNEESLRKTNHTIGNLMKNFESPRSDLKSFELHYNPHWDDDMIEQKIRNLYESNLSIRTIVQSPWLTMFGMVAIIGTMISINYSTRIVDTAIRIYRHFKL